MRRVLRWEGKEGGKAGPRGQGRVEVSCLNKEGAAGVSAHFSLQYTCPGLASLFSLSVHTYSGSGGQVGKL